MIRLSDCLLKEVGGGWEGKTLGNCRWRHRKKQEEEENREPWRRERKYV